MRGRAEKADKPTTAVRVAGAQAEQVRKVRAEQEALEVRVQKTPGRKANVASAVQVEVVVAEAVEVSMEVVAAEAVQPKAAAVVAAAAPASCRPEEPSR
jgi:hypothetical protein